MSRAAIAFLSGLGSGYLTAQDRQQRQAREDEDRNLRKQEHDARMGELERVKKDREALSKAGETATVNDGAVTLDTGGGKPATYDMPNAADVAASDARQFSRNQAATMAPMAASLGTGDVAAPPAAQPAIQSTFAVRGTGYGSKEEAQKAADTYNAPDAVNKRIADAYRSTGRAAEALQIEAGAKQGKLTDIQLANATFKSDLGKAMQQGHDGLADLITKSEAGPMAGVTLKAVPSADGKTVTYSKVGADGTLTPTSLTFSNDRTGVVQAAYMLDKTVTPEHRMDYALKQSKEAGEGKEREAKTNYYNAAAGAKDASAGATAAKTPYERMSEYDKATLTSINKQREKINDAIIKGQAEGTFDPASPGGKSLTTKLAALSLQESQLNAKYGDQAGAPDPIGLRKPAAPGTPETKVAPATQQARDQDRLAILNTELKQAQAKLASGDPRAQGDIDALNREIASTQKGAPAAAASRRVQAPAPAPVAAAPAAAPATSVATGAGALLNPVEAAGVQLDRARAQLDALLKGQRPGLAAGRAAMDAYAAKVQAVKQLVAQSEAKYQSQLPQQGAAFVRPSIQ